MKIKDIVFFTIIFSIMLLLIGLSNWRSQKRLINIDQNKPFNDIWRGEKEKIFLFIFFIIFIPFFAFFLFDTIFYNSWRHLFFLYPPLILAAIFSVDTLYKKFKKKNILMYLNGILIFILFTNIYCVSRNHTCISFYGTFYS